MNMTIATKTTTSTPSKAFLIGMNFGFGEGWSAAYSLLKAYIDLDEDASQNDKLGVKAALTILDRYEVTVMEKFNPEDCISRDEEGF